MYGYAEIRSRGVFDYRHRDYLFTVNIVVHIMADSDKYSDSVGRCFRQRTDNPTVTQYSKCYQYIVSHFVMLYDDIHYILNSHADDRGKFFMTQVSTWANTICTVAVLCALCEMIIPQGNVAKVLHFVLGMFLIIAILIPLSEAVHTKIDFKKDIAMTEEDNLRISAMDDLSIAYGKEVIENLIAETLEENNLTYQKIAVTMDSSGGSRIDMIKVTIYTDISERNRWKEYQQCIKEKTGIQPTVCTE